VNPRWSRASLCARRGCSQYPASNSFQGSRHENDDDLCAGCGPQCGLAAGRLAGMPEFGYGANVPYWPAAPAASHNYRLPKFWVGGFTGSVIENPHGLHWNTFKFSANARLIVFKNVISRPQTGQMTSFSGVTSSLIFASIHATAVPAMTQINRAPGSAPPHQKQRLSRKIAARERCLYG